MEPTIKEHYAVEQNDGTDDDHQWNDDNSIDSEADSMVVGKNEHRPTQKSHFALVFKVLDT